MKDINDFKYPIYRIFFDADRIACTFLDDMIKAFPDLGEKFIKMSWTITRVEPVKKEYEVLAVQDAIDIIDKYE